MTAPFGASTSFLETVNGSPKRLPAALMGHVLAVALLAVPGWWPFPWSSGLPDWLPIWFCGVVIVNSLQPVTAAFSDWSLVNPCSVGSLVDAFAEEEPRSAARVWGGLGHATVLLLKRESGRLVST
jgi:hypothetical protein